MLKMLLIGLSYWIYWPAFLCLGLTLFRFKLKPLIPHIGYTTMVMSFVSIFLQSTKFIYFMSIIQFVSLVLCLFLIFQISLLHSFIMTMFAYSIMLIMETAMNAIFPSTRITVVTEENMLAFFLTILPFSAIPVVLAVVLRKTRLGFSFIVRPKNRVTSMNIIYHKTAALNPVLIISFLTMFIDSLGFFFFPKALALISLVLLSIVGILLRISYKWEFAD